MCDVVPTHAHTQGHWCTLSGAGLMRSEHRRTFTTIDLSETGKNMGLYTSFSECHDHTRVFWVPCHCKITVGGGGDDGERGSSTPPQETGFDPGRCFSSMIVPLTTLLT